MKWFKHYQKYQTFYMLLGFTLFFFVNALTLASSRIMEAMASGNASLPFQTWEPFLWELSSAAMILALVPALNWLLRSDWLSWNAILQTCVVLFLSALVFSVIHVTGMVLIREVAYYFAGGDYRFGDVLFGFLYEFRKDFLTFILLVVAIKSYHALASRLSGEANLVQNGEQASVDQVSINDRILVKKLGKEFIVKVDEIDWLESSGNYVNVHVGERIYPIRSTMAELTDALVNQGFCRIHRSFGVNLDRVESIDVHENGGGDVTLSTGKVLPISRRYREELRGLIR